MMLVQMLIVIGLLFITGSASTALTGFPWINKFSIMNKIYWSGWLTLGSSHLKFDLSERCRRFFTAYWYVLYRCRRVWDTWCLSYEPKMRKSSDIVHLRLPWWIQAEARKLHWLSRWVMICTVRKYLVTLNHTSQNAKQRKTERDNC